MLNFLWKLFVGTPLCAHKWQTFERGEVVSVITHEVVGYFCHQQCRHCGKIKKVDL